MELDDLHEIYFAPHARGAHRLFLVLDVGSHMHGKSACSVHVGGWFRFSIFLLRSRTHGDEQLLFLRTRHREE
jgi:hypothetical protein